MEGNPNPTDRNMEIMAKAIADAFIGATAPARGMGPGPGPGSSQRAITNLGIKLTNLEKEAKDLEDLPIGNRSELYTAELIASLKEVDNKCETICEKDIPAPEEHQVKGLLIRARELKKT